jgi:hypothetical protein
MPMNEERLTTAEEYITDSLDRAQKCLDKIFDPEKDKVNHTAVLSLIGNFNTAGLLEALRRHDPAEADRITQWLEDIHEAGDTTAELVYQWRKDIARGHQLTGLGGYTEEPPAPADAQPFRLQTRGEEGCELEVLAVRTGTPGLLVVQGVTGAGEPREYRPIAGAWSIAHEPSARLLAASSFPLDVALKIAERLGTLGIDWTKPQDNVVAAAGGRGNTSVKEAFRAFEGCRYCTDADHVPVTPWRTAPSTEAGAA